MNRRQMLASGAAVGTAWVIPDLAISSPPAQGAMLSNQPGTAVAQAQAKPDLAFTGDDLQRDAFIGAALIAAGWATIHWAPRIPDTPPPPARGAGR